MTQSRGVLFVHAAHDARLRACRALETWGFLPVAIERLDDALEALVETRRAAIVVDLDLPAFDTLGVIVSLRAHRATRDIVVVALSSASSEDVLELAEGAGCDHVMPMPADLDVLALEIERLLARRSRRRAA